MRAHFEWLCLHSERAKVPKWQHNWTLNTEHTLISRVNRLKHAISIWFDLIGFYANHKRILLFPHFIIVMRGATIDVTSTNDVNALVWQCKTNRQHTICWMHIYFSILHVIKRTKIGKHHWLLTKWMPHRQTKRAPHNTRWLIIKEMEIVHIERARTHKLISHIIEQRQISWRMKMPMHTAESRSSGEPLQHCTLIWSLQTGNRNELELQNQNNRIGLV